ncbi:MAG: hypothetical protein U0Q22_09595 [Acidimicrobiales bacterium]
MREAHIPMCRQVDSGGTTRTGRADFRHQTKPVILEVQSAMYHDALIDRIADAARIAALTRDGFVVREIDDVTSDELRRSRRPGAGGARPAVS